jgi:hypothetical protein
MKNGERGEEEIKGIGKEDEGEERKRGSATFRK